MEPQQYVCPKCGNRRYTSDQFHATGGNLAKRMVEIFLNTEFEGGRHARRVALLDAIQ